MNEIVQFPSVKTLKLHEGISENLLNDSDYGNANIEILKHTYPSLNCIKVEDVEKLAISDPILVELYP